MHITRVDGFTRTDCEFHYDGQFEGFYMGTLVDMELTKEKNKNKKKYLHITGHIEIAESNKRDLWAVACKVAWDNNRHTVVNIKCNSKFYMISA